MFPLGTRPVPPPRPVPPFPGETTASHLRRLAIDALADAAHITALWARHGFYQDRRIPLIRALRDEVPVTGKLPSGDAVTAVVTYPETVDLARVPAMPRWRTPAPIAAGDLQRFQHEVRSCTGIGYARRNSPCDPDRLHHILGVQGVHRRLPDVVAPVVAPVEDALP